MTCRQEILKMTRDFATWQSHSPRWISALEDRLATHGGNDVVVAYEQIAMAFPSGEPNPHSFDSPLIDQDLLRQWALAQGWKIRFAPEMAPQGSSGHPPVRFTRQP